MLRMQMATVSRPGAIRQILLLLCVSACVAAASVHAREFRVADTQPEDYPTVQYMGRLVAERTKGRHTLRVFHSHQLGEEKETIEQTRVGAIDINRINVAPLDSLVPAAKVLSLPFLFRSIDHLHRVLDGPIGQEILNGFRPYGFIGLSFYDSGARSIYNNVRAVRTLADMSGLRIRVQQSDLMVTMIKALGAKPIELPYGQVKTGLSTGLIDGAENNWPSFVTTGHYKYARFYTLTEHTMSPEVVVMSLRAWQSLSPEDQKIFREAAQESNRFMRQRWVALEKRSREQAEAAGVVIVSKFDRAPFEKAMSGIYAKAQQDPTMSRLIERIRKLQ